MSQAPLTGKPVSKYKKAAPKPSITTEERQKNLFDSLCSQIDGEHYENALKTTNKRI